ncbi:fructose-bisphosphate aldolase, class II [Pilibacter termitis]|uniref:Fructose-bisphosphate aldolase, class II n=1 Tax=Pilibacter termitis TaxID=263852 RepID=A0A1T4REC6_9ENTE|nr:ketose-bisphosphate aldolase [Pilibacter termitis]SKA14303.1 fructose-bisphosphate aldolase, class II [Pilibacter termitis]
MLINMNQMLEVAKKEKFAVGAFNISDLALFRTVVETAEAENAPAIIAVHPTELAYAKDDFFKYVVARISNSKIPFVLHLDHGDSMQSVLRAIRCGFSSVMIDGSLLPFEENLKLTKEVVDICHELNVSVEGELGTIGSMGATMEEGVEGVTYTDANDAKIFVEQTGVDTLAIAIGTAHGIYPKGFKPELKMDILEAIKEKIEIPLVLHGGSNNPDYEIQQAVKLGISKVNISSDYKCAIYKKLREILSTQEGWDPNNLFPECIEEGKKVVKQKMELFDSIGKATLYANIDAWRCESL